MIKIRRFETLGRDELIIRHGGAKNVSAIVAEIIENVKINGDGALFSYAEKFDKAHLTALEVSEDEFSEAENLVDPKLKKVLQTAAANIRAFHEKQIKTGFSLAESNGVVRGQKVTPIEKIGVYVPGGTAAYPSTVLMNCIPARIAGCESVVIATPPDKYGKINPAILYAARLSDVSRVFKTGGAGAVAALSYGTETIPKVDKIVGPGNAFVAEAKKQVFGKVAIDMIAGPSEILVIADKNSNPVFVAADMLSQAEHDKMASAVLVTDSETLAEKVSAELEKQIPLLLRADIARSSIDGNGRIIVCDSFDKVFEAANELAPEHLELCVDEPFSYLGKVRNAGSVFLGRYCPEAVGDYYGGPNHTLPTGGTARFSSPLSVDDFVKKTQFLYYPENALKEAKDDVALFAEAEGLTGHAKSVTVRFGE
jgi:histidinol dehydrogenase